MKLKQTLLLLLATPMLLAGCNGGDSTSEEQTSFKVGILLPVEHPALNLAAEGFQNGLNLGLKNGKQATFEVRNASGKASDQALFAKDLVAQCDLTLGVGTGASVDLRSAAIDKGSVKPVLFTAVTDPVDAGLVQSMENGKGFVTGTSDMNPVAAQIALVKECLPEADKIGILYTQSESNSVVQANQAEAAATAAGMSVVKRTATNSSDVGSSALALAQEDGLDAIYIPTDNNIAANTDAVKSQLRNKRILVVTGEESMLAGCGALTLSIDYFELGKRTGAMAAEILNGEKLAKDIPVGVMSVEECEYVLSSENIAAYNLSIPAEVAGKCRDVNADKE